MSSHNKKKEFKQKIQAQQYVVQSDLVNEQYNKIKKKYQFPASFMKAKLHQKAVKFGYNPKKVKINPNQLANKIITTNKSLQQDGVQYSQPKMCPCCNLPINTKRIPLFYHTTNTQPQQIQTKKGKSLVSEFLLNSSTSLYFSFIKMCVVYLLCLFLIVDAYSLFVNLFGKYCQKHQNLCNGNYFAKFSTYNLYEDTTMNGFAYTLDILCLLMVLGSVGFFILYRKFQYKIYDTIDAQNQTQDDYTIFVQNIPILDFKSQNSKRNKESIIFDYEKQLKKIFQTKIDQWLNWIQNKNKSQLKQGSLQYDLMVQQMLEKMRNKSKVRSISLCFDLTQLQKIQQLREQLMEKQINIHYDQLKLDGTYKIQEKDDMSNVQNQIQELNNTEVKLGQKFALDNSPIFNMTHFVGKAFVSFEYQHYREYFIQKSHDKSMKFFYGQNELSISRGTYPTDIFWENMKISNDERKNKVISSFLIVLMVIIFAVFALAGVDVLKTENNNNSQVLSSKDIALNYGLTIFAAIITNVINYGIGYVTKSLTEYQRHKTRTNHLTSLIVKMLISQFINNALVYYIVTLISSRPYMSSTGLILQVSSLIVTSGFISIGMNIINIPYLLRKFNLFRRYRFWSLKTKADTTVPSFQIKLNKDYELPIFDMASKYSYYLLQIYMCMFYNYLVPIGVPVTAIIFAIQYWIDKYQLFYLSSQYYQLNYFLSRTILKIFQGSLLIFTIGNLIFSIVIHDKYMNVVNIISLIVALLYVGIISFASDQLQRKLLFAKYETFEGMSYSRAIRQHKFLSTYWTQNPATVFIKQQDINNSNQFMQQRPLNQYVEQKQLLNLVNIESVENQMINNYASINQNVSPYENQFDNRNLYQNYQDNQNMPMQIIYDQYDENL